jgi:L-amino acid N-acyltransferase YncA
VIELRDARAEDLPQMVAIQNALLATTTIEWRDEPYTVADRQAWLVEHERSGAPVLVAVDGEAVVGFAAYGDFRDTAKWPGYRFAVEHTVHVREDQWGTGVGRALVEALVERARVAGKRVIVAAVDATNTGSIRFHERVGFVEVARLPHLGFKHGRWLDLVLLQRDV